jgi:putative FmdB family regulatory protein
VEIDMPIYEYQCVDCIDRDQRVAGLDDDTALCTQCGGLMLRLEENFFQSYFDENFISGLAEPMSKNKTKTEP